MGIVSDKHSLEYLKTSPTQNLLLLWKYIHHLVQEAQSLPGDAFCQITWKDFMTWRLDICKENHGHTSPSGYQGPSKLEPNPNAQHLMSIKKNIKQEISQYTILKDEKYFESFKRNLLVTATTHSCDEVLDPYYMPGHDADSQELFQ